MAGSVALVLVVQSVATYTSLVPLVRQALPSHSAYVPTTRIYGVTINSALGQATMTFTPFTPGRVAAAFGNQYGMQLIANYPAFGQYIFSLPQIRIGPGPQQHTATVYFPPNATQADIDAYIAKNALTVQTWVSTDNSSGRVAVVALPQIQPVLVNAQLGIWRAMLAPNIDRSRIDSWAQTNAVQVISYNPTTGELLIQGPKPKPGQAHPAPLEEAIKQKEKAEASEVDGRHENTGQKDHKGAR